MKTPRPPKMSCPLCDHWDSDVLNSRGKLGERIDRTRKCRDCGYRFYTEERIVVKLEEA